MAAAFLTSLGWPKVEYKSIVVYRHHTEYQQQSALYISSDHLLLPRLSQVTPFKTPQCTSPSSPSSPWLPPPLLCRPLPRPLAMLPAEPPLWVTIHHMHFQADRINANTLYIPGRRCTVNLGYNYCVEAEEGAVEGAEKPAVESTEEIKAIGKTPFASWLWLSQIH